jgi:hypothetical protein
MITESIMLTVRRLHVVAQSDEGPLILQFYEPITVSADTGCCRFDIGS